MRFLSEAARAFLENYEVTDLSKDPVPIKVFKSTINADEIKGYAIHWTCEYLEQK
jgi:hypothetical protein